MISLSKELLSEVLGFNVSHIEECEHRDNIVGIWKDINKSPIKEINIHELVHKCKKWAWNKLGYEIVQYIDVVKVFSGKRELYESVYDIDYDVNEVIKAAQWLYDKNFKA